MEVTDMEVTDMEVTGMEVTDAERVRALWRDLTGAAAGFAGNGLVVVGTAGHRVSPNGWVGIVAIGGDVVVACPPDVARHVTAALSGRTTARLTDPAYVATLLAAADTRGPAELFSGAPAAEGRRGTVVGPLHPADHRVRAVLDDAHPDERDESGIDVATSGIDVAIAADGRPAAICGWRVWPHGIAHASCLVARRHRGRGHGAVIAGHTLRRAVDIGLLPQWRAAEWNVASISVARRIGLRPLGRQFSLLLR
jgi:hypothetical protein